MSPLLILKKNKKTLDNTRTTVYNITISNKCSHIGGINMKIKNIKKFIRGIFIVLGIIFVLSLIIVKSTLSYTTKEYKTINIKSGDTLWSIALDLQENDKYYNNKNIKYIIEDLKQINNLTTSTLYANQELQIPVI